MVLLVDPIVVLVDLMILLVDSKVCRWVLCFYNYISYGFVVRFFGSGVSLVDPKVLYDASCCHHHLPMVFGHLIFPQTRGAEWTKNR